MKTIKLSCCGSLIHALSSHYHGDDEKKDPAQQVQEHAAENPTEPLRIVIDNFIHTPEDALGLMDTIAFWSDKIDITVDVRFANSWLALVVGAGVDKDKFRISKNALTIFKRSSYFTFGTLTDLKISATAAQEILDQCLSILIAHYGFDADKLNEWIADSAPKKAEEMHGYGIPYIPGAI